MIAPLQLTGFAVRSLQYSENPSFDAEHGVAIAFALRAGGNTLQEFVSGQGEGEPTPLVLDVETALEPLPSSPEDADDSGAFGVYLALAVNASEEAAARAPFSLELVCTGEVFARALPAGKERAELDSIIRANSAGLLYGMARHLILQLTQGNTARGLLLPALSFREIVAAEAAPEAAADG